ncbi:unnamed protein product [Protopolystoma xenopodis]|uniref:Uncharacterized protein n=1 Tax=Protopolystoma xenopodis TaxID=117903 RepID=A0A3S5FF25_9PLAT|nr:unnamed protein product [Protopolystoma xenopodis]
MAGHNCTELRNRVSLWLFGHANDCFLIAVLGFISCNTINWYARWWLDGITENVISASSLDVN